MSCTRQNGVRLLYDQHRFQINIKQEGRELEALGVLGSKGLIRLRNCDDLSVGVAWKGVQKAVDVAVDDDSDTHGSAGCLGMCDDRDERGNTITKA